MAVGFQLAMSADLTITVLPAAAPVLATVEPARVAARVREHVRRLYAAVEPLPHEETPIEHAVVHAARPIRGGFRLEIRYLRDQHPGSRYDKSLTAEGWLSISGDATTLLRGRLGRLRSALDGKR